MNLTVGKLAEAAGVGVETIRFYEKRGLVEQPERRGSGYRIYQPEDVTRIRFIKNAQALGFSLKEIGDLIELERDARSQCSDLQVRTDAKIRVIDQKIEELSRMRSELQRLSSSCSSDQPLSDCKLMNCMAGACQT
jgi:MerR family mercuric resistance operon transcriptional regulator